MTQAQYNARSIAIIREMGDTFETYLRRVCTRERDIHFLLTSYKMIEKEAIQAYSH